MRFLAAWFLAVILACFSNQATFGAAGPCTDARCVQAKDQVDATCHGTGSALIYIPISPENINTYCWCRCSCVAGATPVNVDGTNWKAIQDIKAGESILALQADGTWKSSPVVWSDGLGSATKPFPYAIYVVLATGTTLIVTPDHVFYMPDGSLKRADRLAPTDELALAQGLRPVKITALISGVYYGPMWNVIVEKDENPTSPFGHLINTAGVVSADWALQRQRGERLTIGPQVGTKEYLALHGRYGAEALTKIDKPIILDEARGIKFLPHVPLAPLPPGTVNLLPEGDDRAIPQELHPLDYSIPYEMAQYLTAHYKTHFPEVTFEIDWLNEQVNAWAFKVAGRPYVRLAGGLLRHVRVQIEGAGLVIAHELGHHYGGPPRYTEADKSWASCEGQSDYWGAWIAQRKVWWGEYAIDQTTKGAAQLLDLFSNGLMMKHVVGLIGPRAGICTHPPAQCRYDTYMAGIRVQPKPVCAG